jgi:type II secretory pathway component PulF
MRMPQFKYTARDASGKLVEGTITSNDRTAALLQIEGEKFVPIRIEQLGQIAKPAEKFVAKKSPDSAKPAAPAASAQSIQTLSHNHVFLFTEQLAHLLASGMTLDEALGVLTKRLKHPKLQALSSALHQALVDGRSLSQALRDYPKVFSPLYTNMVAAGEASGALTEILRRLVIHLGEVKAMRDRVQQALYYPFALLGVGVLMIVVFMVWLVPMLKDFFAETGGNLPLATRILLAASHAFVGYWWMVAIAVAGLFSLWKFATRTTEGRLAWDRFLFHLPAYGMVIRYGFYAQFARTLGTLTENGVTLLKSLELLEEISGNEYIHAQMIEARKSVLDGTALSNALRPHGIFPEMFLDMLAVGEQTGRFSETVNNIANVYERDLDKQVKLISALIPIVLIVVIAILVGMLVFGILSAVFNLTTGLRTHH